MSRRIPLSDSIELINKKGFISFASQNEENATDLFEQLNISPSLSHYYIIDVKDCYTDIPDKLAMTVDTVIGFIEPDLKGVSIEEALEAWKQLEIHAYKLVSPCTRGNPIIEGSWLRQFIKGDTLTNYKPRIDVIAFRCVYSPFLNNSIDLRISRIVNILDELFHLFQKPIWITELGVTIDDSEEDSVITEEDVMEYTEKLVEKLNQKVYIERFYWKESDNIGKLFTTLGGLVEITNLGHLYSIL